MNATLFPQTPAGRWWGLCASLTCLLLGFGRMTGWSRDSLGFEYIGGEQGSLMRRAWHQRVRDGIA